MISQSARAQPFRDCLGAKPYEAANADRQQLSFFDALIERLAGAAQNQSQFLDGHGKPITKLIEPRNPQG